jgi:LysM repeat protein
MSAPLVPGAMIAAPAAHADTDWDALAKCESSGNWAINSGNGFSGGLQFTPSTWKAFGGTGKAENASREQQIAVAEKVKSSQGMTAWPVCSKKTGNTDSSPNSGTTKTVSSKKSTSKAAPKTTPKPKKDTGTKVAAARIEAPSGSSYTVKNGDTLSSVAASHGTTWKAMQDRNREVVTDPNMIFPGQTLSMV